MAHVDVAVIGGGLAGLAAGATAARAGASVVILERNSGLGGRGRTTERNGYLFNQGAHALYAGGVGMEVLNELGVRPRGSAPPLADARALRAGRLPLLPTSATSLARTRLVGVRAKVALGKALAAIPQVDPADVAHLSMAEWVTANVADHDAGQVILALTRLATYANAPHLVSAGAVIGQLQATAGVLYLDGGWQQLVDALDETAARADASVVTGAHVRSIERRGDAWAVVSSRGTDTASAVIVAGLAPTVAAGVAGLDPGAFSAAGPPVEAAVLDLSLAAPPKVRFALGIDAPLYFSTHSPPTDMAPPDRAAVVAMKYLPAGAETDHEADRAELVELAGLAGADIVDSRFLRRMTVSHGMPLASQGGLAGRPPISVPHRPGLFVAGDWVGPEGLLADAALASGRAAARAAVAASRAVDARRALEATG